MNSSEIIHNLLDVDIFIRELLETVDANENTHLPPMYNTLHNLHGMIQSHLSMALKNSENTITYNEFHNKVQKIKITKTKECSICLENIEKGSNGCILPCMHIFHEGCIKRWITMNNSNCPICRLNL